MKGQYQKNKLCRFNCNRDYVMSLPLLPTAFLSSALVWWAESFQFRSITGSSWSVAKHQNFHRFVVLERLLCGLDAVDSLSTTQLEYDHKALNKHKLRVLKYLTDILMAKQGLQSKCKLESPSHPLTTEKLQMKQYYSIIWNSKGYKEVEIHGLLRSREVIYKVSQSATRL